MFGLGKKKATPSAEHKALAERVGDQCVDDLNRWVMLWAEPKLYRVLVVFYEEFAGWNETTHPNELRGAVDSILEAVEELGVQLESEARGQLTNFFEAAEVLDAVDQMGGLLTERIRKAQDFVRERVMFIFSEFLRTYHPHIYEQILAATT
jgi:hypothetical protein